MFNPDEFELINSEITAADAQSDQLVDDLAGMSFQSTIPEKVDEVPEKIKLWRENFSKNLEEKDERELREKEELRVAAQREMDEWVSKYKDTIERAKNLNRSNEEPVEPEPTESTDKNMWESITKLCDFTGKGPKNTKDASRMRSIFVQMKSSPRVN